eukprot:Lithocolla_globosa_v1_NODE_3727_length_1596_cov_49.229721.p2 type:complete len:156 gc:universal NODE_3727_length_1596_cov_49.229721:821-354(-)
MFKDGLSVSGFGEKIMTKMSWGDFHQKWWQYIPRYRGKRSGLVSDGYIQDKISGYKDQDKMKKRDLEYDLTIPKIRKLLVKSNWTCVHCACDCTKSFTLDRIDNRQNHKIENCVVSCAPCNVKRDKSLKQFQYQLCQEIYAKLSAYRLSSKYHHV